MVPYLILLTPPLEQSTPFSRLDCFGFESTTGAARKRNLVFTFSFSPPQTDLRRPSPFFSCTSLVSQYPEFTRFHGFPSSLVFPQHPFGTVRITRDPYAGSLLSPDRRIYGGCTRRNRRIYSFFLGPYILRPQDGAPVILIPLLRFSLSLFQDHSFFSTTRVPCFFLFSTRIDVRSCPLPQRQYSALS